jgi:hypothetical protein
MTHEDFISGHESSYPISFDPSDGGFTIHTPSPLPDIPVSWNGVVFDDLNGNDERDASEPGLSGYRVYLDTNNNGRLDRVEPVAISDVTGSYNFGQLPNGKFVARAILPNQNVAQTNLLATDVFDPSTGDNMQYHFSQQRRPVRRRSEAAESGAQPIWGYQSRGWHLGSSKSPGAPHGYRPCQFD